MEKTICIFGDSITMGAWDLEKGGWGNRLRLFIDTEQRSGGIKDYFATYNLGVDGDTTDGLLKRFQAEAEFRNSSIIIFAIGSNDSVFDKAKNKFLVPLDEFEINIKRLIDEARNISQTVIFLSAGIIDEKKTKPLVWASDFYQENKNVLLYNQKIKEITEKNEVLYLDIFDSLSEKDLEDGVHPNSGGHEKIYLKVKDFLLNNKVI
jgi:lysophospholipase L1-like esterase